MIIPFDKSKNSYDIGDKVTIIKSIQLDTCYVTEGHEFIIVDDEKRKGYSNYYKLKDIDSDVILRTTSDNFKIKIDYHKSILISEKIKNKKKFIDFILKNCPNKYDKYDDREVYDACKLKKTSYGEVCQPCISCISYINKDKIKKDEFISSYLRGIKIKKIIK